MTKKQYVDEFLEMTKSRISGILSQQDYNDYCGLLGTKLKNAGIDLLKFAEYTRTITL